MTRLPPNFQIGVGQGLFIPTEFSTSPSRRYIVASTLGAEHVVVATILLLRLESRHYFILRAALILDNEIGIGNRRSILAQRLARAFRWRHLHILTATESRVEVVDLAIRYGIPGCNVIQLGTGGIIQNHFIGLGNIAIWTAQTPANSLRRFVLAPTEQSIV